MVDWDRLTFAFFTGIFHGDLQNNYFAGDAVDAVDDHTLIENIGISEKLCHNFIFNPSIIPDTSWIWAKRAWLQSQK